MCEINCFAVEALIAAYNEGDDWLDELRVYLYDNYKLLSEFFQKYLPHLTVLPLEATYLVWVDCSSLGITSKEIVDKLWIEEKLWLNEGTMYGEAGEGFVRINIATQRDRLIRGLKKFRHLFGG